MPGASSHAWGQFYLFELWSSFLLFGVLLDSFTYMGETTCSENIQDPSSWHSPEGTVDVSQLQEVVWGIDHCLRAAQYFFRRISQDPAPRMVLTC